MDARPRQLEPPTAIGVAAIEDDERAGRERHLAGFLDIAAFAVAQHDVPRQAPVVIEHQVKLEGSFGALVMRPVEALGAQLFGARENLPTTAQLN